MDNCIRSVAKATEYFYRISAINALGEGSPPSIICGSCGASLNATAKFCSQCGQGPSYKKRYPNWNKN